METTVPFDHSPVRQKNGLYFSDGRPIYPVSKILDAPTILHTHDFYELELITEGEGEYYHNGTTFPLERGLLFFMTPTDFHQIVPKDTCKIHTVEINENIISSEWQTFFMSHPTTAVYKLSEAELEQWMARHTAARAEYELSDDYSAENMIRLLEVLLSCVARIMKREQKAKKSRSSFQQALDYIAHHYNEPLSLEEIATAVGYTPQYFCSLFRQQTGRQLMDFITDLRLNYAKMLLRTTNLSATEICFRSGFNSQSAFFRQFRLRMEQSPADYRKNNIVWKGTGAK